MALFQHLVRRITSQHVGEWASGIHNAEVQACDQVMKRHGVPGFTSEKKDNAVVSYCDLFSFFKAAVDKAGVNPGRTTIAQGVAAMGLLKTAIAGDGNFDRPGKITGGDFVRTVQFHADCACWKIVDPAFRPAYQ